MHTMAEQFIGLMSGTSLDGVDGVIAQWGDTGELQVLQHASADASSAFIGSRFDPDWGPVTGITSGSHDPAALLRAAWAG